MPSLIQAIAPNLARLRKEKGWTQQQLADAVGLNRVTIANYESGEGGIKADTITRLAQIFEIEETELFGPAVPIKTTQEAWEFLENTLRSQGILRDSLTPLGRRARVALAPLNDEELRIHLPFIEGHVAEVIARRKANHGAK